MATLRELLVEDGYGSDSDTGILVHDRLYGTMAVSHRYLCCAPWKDVINSSAIRLSKGEYATYKNDIPHTCGNGCECQFL